MHACSINEVVFDCHKVGVVAGEVRLNGTHLKRYDRELEPQAREVGLVVTAVGLHALDIAHAPQVDPRGLVAPRLCRHRPRHSLQ